MLLFQLMKWRLNRYKHKTCWKSANSVILNWSAFFGSISYLKMYLCLFTSFVFLPPRFLWSRLIICQDQVGQLWLKITYLLRCRSITGHNFGCPGSRPKYSTQFTHSETTKWAFNLYWIMVVLNRNLHDAEWWTKRSIADCNCMFRPIYSVPIWSSVDDIDCVFLVLHSNCCFYTSSNADVYSWSG